MKKYIIPVLAALALLASCTSKFDEMNTDSTALTASSVQAHMVFARCVYHGMSNDHQRNFNLNDDMYAHYFAEGLGWTDYWRYNEGWGNIYWRDFYTERLPEYHLINSILGDDPDYNGMKAANDIWNVILWLRIVDRYGDAPYKDDEGNYAGQGVTMPYTPSSQIYPDLIARLQNDVNLLSSPGQKTFGDYDLVYANDWSKWKKLANTLILRLALRFSVVDPATGKTLFAKTFGEGGFMNAPSDYCRVNCDTYVWGDYYDRTFYDWANTFTSSDFMKMMNGNNPGYATGIVDPRRAFWFTKGEGANGWDGFPNGNYEIDKRADVKKNHGGSDSFAKLNCYDKDGFFFFNFHNTRKENLSWCLASYSETCFLCAEAAARGWISADAKAWYEKGIKASMDEVAFIIKTSGGTKTISEADKNAYIAALPSFGTGKDMIRSIMIQKWIALFPNSCEAWVDQRRTGYPDYFSGVLTYPTIHPSSLVDEGNIVQRIPYPDNEYNNNAAMMPDKYKDGTRDQQSNLWFANGGPGNTQSKNKQP